MNMPLILGVVTVIGLVAILFNLKRLNVVFTILAVCGFIVFAGLAVTLVAAAAGVDSLMIDQTNPPW